MIGDGEGYLSLWNINEQCHIGKNKAHDAAIRGMGSTVYVGSFDQYLTFGISNKNYKKKFF